MKKVCVFIGNRANYSSIKSVMTAIVAHPKLQLQVVLGAAALLERFGNVAELIKNDGFEPDYVFHNLIEGENTATMAKSTGMGLMDASVIFSNLKPDMLVVVGDRFEMMSVTLAAAYMNIVVVHTMGGEVTGTIDESIRHAITKFSHVHFPANEDSRSRIIKMGEDPNFVFNVGCPRTDLIGQELQNDSSVRLARIFNDYGGVGEALDLSKPYLLVSQHSVTTEFGSNRYQIEETLEALNELRMPTIMLWPNPDAGSDDVSKGIRSFRENNNPVWLHMFKNLPIHIYIHLMNTTSCLIGNSSSGLRDGAFIGTPVVNIGTRQNNRLRSENVLQAGYDSREIVNAVRQQIKHGKYASSDIYGDGTAGAQIADILADVSPNIQKTITY
jgi:UDP-hydrolysing UDP-N-acetyl-D-glucosamine 2-epimerase